MLLAAAREDTGDLVKCAEILLTLEQASLNRSGPIFISKALISNPNLSILGVNFMHAFETHVFAYVLANKKCKM